VPRLSVILRPPPNAPKFLIPSSTGAAVQSSPALAREAALMEVAERDIATRCWFEEKICELNPTELAPVELAAIEAGGFVLKMAGCCSGPLPVVMASIHRPSDGLGAFGVSNGFTYASCAIHAIEEAVQMYHHLGQSDRLIFVDQIWKDTDCRGTEASLNAYDAEGLLAAYDPVCVDLTTTTLTTAGLYLKYVWSPHAVDFPVSCVTPELRRWQADERTLQRYQAQFHVFRGCLN